MKMPDIKVFDVKITSHAAPSPRDGSAHNAIFEASITVAGIPVFTRYYTNNTQAQMTLTKGGVSYITTGLAVYDPDEATVFLLRDFGKFLAEKWMQ